jgi:hypothetical protein
VVPFVLVLTPSPAAPDTQAIRVTGYEPQIPGILVDRRPAHLTLKEIHRIPSCFYQSDLHVTIPTLYTRAQLPFRLRPTPTATLRAQTLSNHATSFGHEHKLFLGLRWMCAYHRQYVCTPRCPRRLASGRATPPASRQQDHWAFSVAPQLRAL